MAGFYGVPEEERRSLKFSPPSVFDDKAGAYGAPAAERHEAPALSVAKAPLSTIRPF